MARNIKSNVPVKNGARKGSYQVFVRLVVNNEGYIKDIVPLTNFGFGMEEEVIRVIRNAPKWTPRIYLNKRDNITFRQPITFVVEER